MPRSLDVILRSELVERAKAGDKCVFTGTFIVVPDVSQLGLPGGNKAQLMREASKGNPGTGGGGGVTGLKSLGVRELQYKTAFLACMVHDSDGRVSVSLCFLLCLLNASCREGLIYVVRKNKAKKMGKRLSGRSPNLNSTN